MGKERGALEVVQFVSSDNATGHFGECITRIQWKDPDCVDGGLILLFHFLPISISSPSLRRRQSRETEGWR